MRRALLIASLALWKVSRVAVRSVGRSAKVMTAWRGKRGRAPVVLHAPLQVIVRWPG